MKTLNYLFIGLVVVSCSGEATTTRSIINDSDQDVVLQLYNSGFAYGDTIRLSPGDSKQISVKTYNQVEDEENDCSQNLDSAYSRTSSGGHLTKNISSNNNWEVLSEQTKTIPPEYEHQCIFHIYNSDISE